MNMFAAQSAKLLETGPWLYSLDMIALALPFLTVAGAAAISFCSSLSGRFSGTVFADKLARQLAEFGVIILGFWLLLVSVRWGLSVVDWWPAGALGRGFYPLFFDLPGQLVLLATLLSIVLVRTWKRGKRTTGAHMALGGAATALWALVLALFALAGTRRLESVLPDARMIDHLGLAGLAHPLSWLVWGHLLFMAAASGAGFGLLYLLMRRNREDYGRDYYIWSVKRCAWWAIISGIGQVGWAGAVFWASVLAYPERSALAGDDWINIGAALDHAALPGLAFGFLFALLGWLSLLPVGISKTPLRMKGWMLLHAACFMASLAGLCRMYVSLL